MDVALDGADDHLADGRRPGLGQERAEDRHPALHHRVGGEEHLGDEQDAVPEVDPDDAHAFDERIVQNALGHPSALQQDVRAFLDLFLQAVIEIVVHLPDELVVGQRPEIELFLFLACPVSAIELFTLHGGNSSAASRWNEQRARVPSAAARGAQTISPRSAVWRDGDAVLPNCDSRRERPAIPPRPPCRRWTARANLLACAAAGQTMHPAREGRMNDGATDTKIIDGKRFADGLRARVAARVEVLKDRHDLRPGLAVVLVGDNPASEVYVRNKAKRTRAAGMRSFEHRLPATTSQEDLLALVGRLNDDPQVSGILVQLPLPAQIGADAVIATIDPEKDVDGFHTTNAGLLSVGGDGMVPVHPARLPDAAEGPPRGPRGRAGSRARPLEHRGQADGPPADPRELHGDRRPLPDPGPRRGMPARGHPRGRGGPAADGSRELGPAGRGGHRRRHQPDRRGETARPCWSATWTSRVRARWRPGSLRYRAASDR